MDDKVCFPFESSIKHITEIKLFVSSASVRKKKQIFVAEKTCTATFLSNMERLLSNGENADVEIHCKDEKGKSPICMNFESLLIYLTSYKFRERKSKERKKISSKEKGEMGFSYYNRLS